MKKEPKDKDSKFESFVFWASPQDHNGSKESAKNESGCLQKKALSARNPIAIYRALICLKETFSQDKEARIIDVFLTSFFAGRQVMRRHPRGENAIS